MQKTKHESRFQQLLKQAIILPAIVAVVISTSLIWQISELHKSWKWVSHTDKVISQSQLVLKLIIDSESAVRGYALTHGREDLRLYQGALKEFETESKNLESLVQDNPKQHARIQEILRASHRWFSIPKSSMGAVQYEEVHRIMNFIRAKFSEFIQSEERYRDVRNDEVSVTSRNMIILGILISIIIGAIIVMFIRRSLRSISEIYQDALTNIEQSELRYKLAMVATKDAIWDWNVSTNETLWTDAITSSFGYVDHLWKGDTWLERIHPEDRKRVEKSFYGVVEGKKEIWTDQYRFQKQDGSYAYVMDRGFLVMENGTPTRMIGAMQDITENIVESEKRREAEAVRDIFFNLPNLLLCVAGTDGYFKRLNPAWSKALGFSIEELQAKPWIEFVHPDDVEASTKMAEKIRGGYVNTSFINRYRTKDGTYKWLHWTSDLRGDEFYCFVSDITGVMLAEQNLLASQMATKRSEDKLKLITNRLPVFVAYVGKDERYQFTNQAYEQWFQHPSGVLVGKTVREVLGDEYETSAPFIRKALEGKQVKFERTLIRDKGTRHIQMEYVPDIEPFSMEVNGFVVVGNDVSDLTNAVKARDAFLSIASHELRTPLTAMQLQTQIAKRNIQKDPVKGLALPAIQKVLDQGESSMKRLTRLVDDMLDISRISMGKLTLYKEDCDLTQIIRDLVERLGPQFETARMKVDVSFSDEIHGYWDGFKIDQVITNLLMNALKYAEAAPVTVQVERVSDLASIAITDRGPGIAEADQKRIFQRFERAAAPGVSGLGLGLYISREIVERHGGTLSVSSIPGQGATFLVLLPIGELS